MHFSFEDCFDHYLNKIINLLSLYRITIDNQKFFNRNNISSDYNNFDQQKKLEHTISELRKRVDDDFYKKIFLSQIHSLFLAKLANPGYQFLQPNVIKSDWLSIVNWDKYSRDHLVHQLLTSYVAFKLITESKMIKNKINQINWNDLTYLKNYLLSLGLSENHILLNQNDSERKLSNEIWKEMLFRALLVASLFHDCGNPWQFTHGLEKTLFNYGLSCSNSQGKELFEQIRNKLIMYPFNGYRTFNSFELTWKENFINTINNTLIYSHGFNGAIVFMYLYDSLLFKDNSVSTIINRFIIDWASMAIMMHDLSKFYWNKKQIPENPFLRLKLNIDPLSTLLTLCDIIQEFERPDAVFESHPKFVKIRYNKDESNKNRLGCFASELKETESFLNICYLYNEPSLFAKKNIYIKQEENEFFNPINGYIDISSLGLNKVTLSTKLEH